ncbi:MAG: tyrosine-type recombinase/integrase [Hyphomicrobiaceae bacterium]
MSQLKLRITKTSVDSLGPGQEIRDTELKGFGARCQLKGVSYFVHSKINGRLRRVTIGKHGSPFTAETARKEATKLLLAIRSGEDPLAKRHSARANQMTLAAAGEAFFLAHGSKLKPRTLIEYKGLMAGRLVPRLGKVPIRTLSYSDIASAHAAWAKTPRHANHALALLSKLLNWAEDAGLRDRNSNPCGQVKRYRENKRERYLTMKELAHLGEVLTAAELSNEINRYVIAAVRLLLLTGARLGEILTLKWSYIDLERRRIHLPDSKTGAKTLILGDAAITLLDGLGQTQGNPYVLPGNADGSHLVGIHGPWAKLRVLAGIPDVRIHDLRHSYAAFAVDAGGSLPVIGKLLGHHSPQTTARYAHVAPAPADLLATTADRMIADTLLPKTVR